MMLHIPNLIDPVQLKVMQAAINKASFVDGKLSAGKTAKKVKNNQELDHNNQVAQNLGKIMVGNLYNNEQFKSATLPYRIAEPLFARYQKGMQYGAHIDDPVMGDVQRFRCDVAVTLFLNDPDEYQGGELVVRTPFGLQKTKYPAGDIVLYPASSLHYVEEVTGGQRLVGVVWVQSMVREPAKREILYDLSLALQSLSQNKNEVQSFEHVDHCYTNLIRMWAEV